MSPTSEGRTAPQRRVLLTVHTGRQDIVALARRSAARLQEGGIVVRLLDDEAGDLDIAGAEVVPADAEAALDTEIVMVFGGDGTFLRAAELARFTDAALMGVNLVLVVFAVVVIGGMGSIMGSIVTGFGLGLVEGLTKVFYPPASNTVIFVVMAIVLLIKPAGLFGQTK